MRTILIAVFIVLVSAVLAFAVIPGLWMHTKQVPRDIAREIDSSVPDDHVLGVYDAALSGANNELKQRYSKVYRAKVEMAKIESAMKVQKDQLSKEEQVLTRSQEILNQAQSGSTVTVAGCNYSWDEINQDALNRLSTCKALRKQIAGNEQSLSKLRQAYEEGVKAIADKQEELRRRKMDFEAEKVELAVLRAQESVNGIIGEINQAGDIRTKVASARKLFDDRLNDLRAKVEYDQQISFSKAATIPWNKELGLGEKAATGIESYFKEGKASRSEKRSSNPSSPH